MARSAEHVYTDEPTILALEALVRELPTNGRVRLELTNGDRCEGVIVERPNVQLYLDPSDRREGINCARRRRIGSAGSGWTRSRGWSIWIRRWAANADHASPLA